MSFDYCHGAAHSHTHTLTRKTIFISINFACFINHHPTTTRWLSSRAKQIHSVLGRRSHSDAYFGVGIDFLPLPNSSIFFLLLYRISYLRCFWSYREKIRKGARYYGFNYTFAEQRKPLPSCPKMEFVSHRNSSFVRSLFKRKIYDVFWRIDPLAVFVTVRVV